MVSPSFSVQSLLFRGCPTTAMWVYRLGMERAKRILLTGDIISGKEAERIGLITACYPAAELDAQVEKLAARMASVPKNQLMMHKMLVNQVCPLYFSFFRQFRVQAYENMGLASTQRLATLFDGIARHTPEGVILLSSHESWCDLFPDRLRSRNAPRLLDGRLQ